VRGKASWLILRGSAHSCLIVTQPWLTRLHASHRHLQELRYLATVVRMQRLFRRQLARKRQWQRLLDVMSTVLSSVRATRCAFDTWAEELWEAQSAAGSEAMSRSRRWGAAGTAAASCTTSAHLWLGLDEALVV
jgi:hypothetical protein